jgi:D-alanine--D-alanine ligase
MTKLKVAVIFGGASNEREISLESGRNIFYKLSSKKYDVTPVFLDANNHPYRINEQMIVHNSTKGISESLTPDMRLKWSELSSIADFVFLGLHGGMGENGCIQGALEMLGIPYNGSSVLASAMCMDKYRTNEFLRGQGFAVPKNSFLTKAEWLLDQETALAQITKQLPYPLIVKPHDDGCSVFVSMAKSNDELRTALNQIFMHKDHALIEEKVVGMELTVGVVGNEQPCALPPSYAVANKAVLSIEEKFLPGAGENQTPAPLPASALTFVQRVVEAAYKTIGCRGYARIDCFYQTAEQSPTGVEQLVFLECNTLPGMTPATVLFHQAAEIGISPASFLDLIVELGLIAHAHHAPKEKVLSSEDTMLQPVRENVTKCFNASV